LLVGLFRRRLLVGLLGRRSLVRRLGGILVSRLSPSRLRGLSSSLVGRLASLTGLSPSLVGLALLRGKLLPGVRLLGVARVVTGFAAELEAVPASFRGLLALRGPLVLWRLLASLRLPLTAGRLSEPVSVRGLTVTVSSLRLSASPLTLRRLLGLRRLAVPGRLLAASRGLAGRLTTLAGSSTGVSRGLLGGVSPAGPLGAVLAGLLGTVLLARDVTPLVSRLPAVAETHLALATLVSNRDDGLLALHSLFDLSLHLLGASVVLSSLSPSVSASSLVAAPAFFVVSPLSAALSVLVVRHQ
jgi:hypothetical protein